MNNRTRQPSGDALDDSGCATGVKVQTSQAQSLCALDPFRDKGRLSVSRSSVSQKDRKRPC